MLTLVSSQNAIGTKHSDECSISNSVSPMLFAFAFLVLTVTKENEWFDPKNGTLINNLGRVECNNAFLTKFFSTG
jgi:hypothetical protein